MYQAAQVRIRQVRIDLRGLVQQGKKLDLEVRKHANVANVVEKQADAIGRLEETCEWLTDGSRDACSA